MKTLILLLFLPFMVISQTYPVIQEFNPPLAWTVTNGAGIQNYGTAENYLTTNIGNTPYPNNSVITMTSPVASYTNCATVLTVTFPLVGIIENTWDFMSFQYSINGGTSWITLGTYTGSQNVNYSYNVPNTANRFRFRLVTDPTVNTYGPPGNPYVYYYDIARFVVNCSSVMPVELAYFKGYNQEDFNVLEWQTVSEDENDYFEVYHSEDAINWELHGIANASGVTSGSTYYLTDQNFKNIINYYKLIQVDNNGTKHEYNIVSIDNEQVQKEIISITNILGQSINDSYKGLVLITYSDGRVEKVYR